MKAAGRLLLGASVLAGVAVSLTSAALADRSVRDVVYSHTADLALFGDVQPSGTTVGRLAAVDVLVEDRGPATAQNVVLSAQLPTLSTFVSTNQSTGTCSVFAGTLTCALGAVPRSIGADFPTLLRMPSTAGPQVTTVHVRSTTKDLVKSNNTRNYTVNALARSKDSVSAYIVAPGGKLSTGHSTSSTNPTSTTVQAHTEYSGLLTIAGPLDHQHRHRLRGGLHLLRPVRDGRLPVCLRTQPRRHDRHLRLVGGAAPPVDHPRAGVRLWAHRPQVLRRVQRLGGAGPLRRIQNAAFQRQLAAGDPLHRAT